MSLIEYTKNPDFLSISGSRLYGTYTPESDYDLRGFTIPPFEYIIGINKFECMEMEGDHKIFSLKRFLDLVLSGDPQCTEILFSPKDCIKRISDVGEHIISLKKDMISMKIYNRILGYSISEWRKAMAVKIVPEKRKKDKEELICSIRELYNLDKESIDSIISILNSSDKKKIISSVPSIGDKRKKDIIEFGYCRKSASHSIRLVSQLIELMSEGKITFPRLNAPFLLRIRNGEYEKNELQKFYDDFVSQAEKLKERSILPDNPNRKKIMREYKEIIMSFLKKDVNFNKLGV